MNATLFTSPVAMPDLSTPCAWAGVGSRETTPDVLALMTRIARRLGELGHTLRTGAAPGADTAFEAGHREACGAERLEVYLPWPGFELESRDARGWFDGVVMPKPSERATSVAEMNHPKWMYLTRPQRKLISRNSHQAFGRKMDSVVRFAVLWTQDGAVDKRQTTRDTGGTGQVVRLLSASTPIFNLKRDDHRLAWERWLGG